MRIWILGAFLYPCITITFAQKLDTTFGQWWAVNQTYQKFKVELGKTYILKGDGYYDFWYNGNPIPVIQQRKGETILYIPPGVNVNNQVYAERVQTPTHSLKLASSENFHDSLRRGAEFLIEKDFKFREYYSKETIGPEQLLRNSFISDNESWGTKPTFHEQIPLDLSNDTIVQQIDVKIKNLGYNNDLEIYLDGQLTKEYDKLIPYEELIFQIGRDNGLRNSSTIEIKSKKSPQHKFSIGAVKISGKVQSLPTGSFKLMMNNLKLFIPCDSSDSDLKIIDWEDGVYFIPQKGLNGWGFYLNTNREGKTFTTISPAVSNIIQDSLKEITFRNNEVNQTEYLIIVADEIVAKDGAKEKLEEYITFRSREEGGKYAINWMNYETIYHQYGYGFKYSYQGLFNFFRKLKYQDSKPKIVWFIGKGYGLDSKDQWDHLIPSYGYPASDFLLVNDPNDTNYSMVARLAVTNGNALIDYLEKVMDYELMKLDDEEFYNWRKEVLHIAGGKSEKEINENTSILQKAWNSDLSEKLGMKLFQLNKPIGERNNSNLYGELLYRLKKGIGIRVFLGHGGITSTEIGLDNPDLLPTYGRYPLMLDLGCQTGNIFSNKNSLSEQFTLASKKGAIGYIGSSGYGYASSFSTYLSQFYLALSGNQENRNIGEIFLKALQPLVKSNFYGSQILGQQLNFHGDPFVQLFNSRRPDYKLSKVILSAEPTNNEVFLQGSVTNLGRLQADDIEIIIHVNNIEFKRDTISIEGEHVAFKTKVSLNGKPILSGVQFKIACRQIPNDDKLVEWDTVNNFFLEEGMDIKGMVDLKYPLNHSLVHSEDFLGLIVEVNYPGDYYVELDTNDQFFQPKRFFKSITTTPTLLHIELDTGSLINNQRYYWRFNRDTASTFFYSKDKRGTFYFNHPSQFKILSTPEKAVEYSILIQAVVRTEENQLRSRFFRDGLRLVNAGLPLTFNVVVIDPESGFLIDNRRFEATTNHDQVLELIDFLENEVEENHLVSLFTFHYKGQSYHKGQIGKGESPLLKLGEKLKQEGSQKIDVFLQAKNVPYLIVFQKGIGVIQEKVGSEGMDKIEALIIRGVQSMANPSYSSDWFGPMETWDSVSLSSPLKGLKLLGIETEGGKIERDTLNNSGILDRSLSHKNFLSIQLDDPLKDLEIEFFGLPKKEVNYDILLENDSLEEGQAIQVLLNGLVSTTPLSKFSNLCLTLLGHHIEKDTCIELPSSNVFALLQVQLQLWDDIPSGEYLLRSDWSGHLDSISFSILPYSRFPKLSFMVNGERHIPMQAFKSGKKIRIQVESTNNHYYFQHQPRAAVEIKLVDTNGKFLEVSNEEWEVLIDHTRQGLTIQLDGMIEVNKAGIYRLVITPKTIYGILIEGLRKNSVVDVFPNYGIEEITFFPNPFKSKLGLNFYYWGDHLPDSLKVTILNTLGNVVKEIDLVQTGQIQMGRNTITDLLVNEMAGKDLLDSVYYYLIKLNQERVISGRLINVR
jgi:hypothetical protein